MELEWLLERLDPRNRRAIELKYALTGGEPRDFGAVGRQIHLNRQAARRLWLKVLKDLAWLVDTHEAWTGWQSLGESARMAVGVELLVEIDREHEIAPAGVMKGVVVMLRQSNVMTMGQLMALGDVGLHDIRGFRGKTQPGFVKAALAALGLTLPE